jgi:hypothetical protein
MKKLLVFILIVICASLLGGCYGIVHDQITFTISNEYYTKFKFHQFELVPDGFEEVPSNARALVAIVGFLATWWMGTFIGVILGLVAFILPSAASMFRVSLTAFAIVLIIAFATGAIGLGYGLLVLSEQPRASFEHWYIPQNVIDFKNFIAVGSAHNFSYLGGVLGLIGGKVYILYIRFRGRSANA